MTDTKTPPVHDRESPSGIPKDTQGKKPGKDETAEDAVRNPGEEGKPIDPTLLPIGDPAGMA